MFATIVSWIAVFMLGVVIVGLLISHDWRWSLGLLAALYVATAWLVGQHWPAGMAAVKLVTGWMAAAALGMTHLALPEQEEEDTSWPQGIPFRLFAAAIIVVIAFAAAQRIEDLIPGIGLPVVVGSLLLISSGLLQLGITSQILRVTIGLLTFLSGFEILYAAVESSILVAGLLAVANLGLALAGSYLLAQSNTTTEEEEVI
ncbi:MAG TPA: hypothetical protein VMT73_10835 [Anaerolineales bacterium]|nr:hypothetical protein [Anaerolineales bacterium]